MSEMRGGGAGLYQRVKFWCISLRRKINVILLISKAEKKDLQLWAHKKLQGTRDAFHLNDPSNLNDWLPGPGVGRKAQVQGN